LPATLAQGISVGSWKTKPTRRLAAVGFSPRGHSTAPLVGSLKPAMMRSAVDLPQPEGPSSVTNSPGHTSKSKRSSACTPFVKLLPTPRNATV
jgi:hypothetical protein